MEPESQNAISPRGSIRIAEGWADLTRALTLYPETNSRVLRSLAALMEFVQEALAEANRVEIAFSAEAVWVGDTAYEFSPTSNLAWLKERLERGSLSGAILSEQVDEEALIAFTKRLLEVYTRRDMSLSFDELWPTAFSGMALLEKRFDGAFSDRHEEEGVSRPSVAGRSRRMEETLSNALTKDERVQDRMAAIQDRILASASENGLESIDLLGSIIELLPEEALNNYQTAVDLTLKVLETVNAQMSKGQMTANLGNLKDDNTFQRLLFVISRTHFNRIDPGKRPDQVQVPKQEANDAGPDEPQTKDEEHPAEESKEKSPEKAVLRAGDDKIDDSLPALEREMDELAPLETKLLRTEDLEDFAEQLGVYLHYLVRLEKPHTLTALQAGIAELLRAPDGDTVGVLREYLEPLANSEIARSEVRLSRVAMWLRRHGRRDLLKRCGVLTADWVCREFPEEFLVYVQTLDLSDELDVAELNNVCTMIGPERFAQAKDLLTGATDFLDGAMPKRLFLFDQAGVAPFVRQIFDKRRRHYKSEFALFLSKTVAESIDQKILEIMDGSKFLLSEYLIAIAEGDAEKLSEQRLSILYSFIVATDQDLLRISKRERAIKLLANFDRPHIRAFLQRLVAARKFLIIPEQPRRIRKAATAVLRAFRERGKS